MWLSTITYEFVTFLMELHDVSDMQSNSNMADLTETFVREIEVFNTTLKVHQAAIGDVGCVVWDAAIVLAKYLEKMKSEALENKRVLELGSGTGVVGLCCCLVGANVICTDLKELLPLIELNKKTNILNLKGKFDVQELKWGETVGSLLPSVDYLIMSDVIYYSESLEPLIKTICDLAGDNTQVLMSYEQRFDGNKPFLEKRFFELVGEYFDSKKIPLEEQDPTYQCSDIHIISMTRRKISG